VTGSEKTLQRQALDRLRDWLDRVRGEGVAIPEVRLRFDLRGVTAGQAIIRDPQRPEIRLNAHLLAANGEAFLSQTIPHEVAHLAVYYRLGRRPRRPHGPEWQRQMRAFGIAPERCHRYDVTDARVRRLQTHPYRCACRDHQLTTIRHNRVLRGEQSYRCRTCGETLRPVP